MTIKHKSELCEMLQSKSQTMRQAIESQKIE